MVATDVTPEAEVNRLRHGQQISHSFSLCGRYGAYKDSAIVWMMRKCFELCVMNTSSTQCVELKYGPYDAKAMMNAQCTLSKKFIVVRKTQILVG